MLITGTRRHIIYEKKIQKTIFKNLTPLDLFKNIKKISI